MWITIEMHAQHQCIRCKVLTPLSGLREIAVCHGCGARLQIEKLLADALEGGTRCWFGGYHDAVADAVVNPNLSRLADTTTTSQVQLVRKELACRCGSPLQRPQAPAAQLVCPACHVSSPVRWPDDATARWDPRLFCVVGDGGESDAAAASPHPIFLVYSLDDQALLEVWQWVGKHPNRMTEENADDDDDDVDDDDDDAAEEAGEQFRQLVARRIAELSGSALAIRCKRVLAARGPIELAAVRELVVWPALGELDALKLDPRLTDDQRAALIDLPIVQPLAVLWSRSSSATTRYTAARAQGLDPATLATLASDGEATVRAAIAARADVPAPIIATLRKDRDANVAAAAKANPAHKVGLLSRLFGS